jgi:chemotaxis signal transduction protein
MNASALHYSEQRLPVPQADQTECRCFTVIDGDEMFGLPVESVQTIFRIEGVTPVPLGPAEVEGLVNLRGRIVTAVSLKRRLSKAALDSTRGTLAIGIEHDGENFALIVDDVGDVITCEERRNRASAAHRSGAGAADPCLLPARRVDPADPRHESDFRLRRTPPKRRTGASQHGGPEE